MRRIVVIGHGGYAEGVRQNIEMVAGVSEYMYFIDLTKQEDLASLESRVNSLIQSFGDDEVLFVADILGASPFRVAAMICTNNIGKYYLVSGLNTMALLELSLNGQDEISIEELANRAVETTKAAVVRFPE